MNSLTAYLKTQKYAWSKPNRVFCHPGSGVTLILRGHNNANYPNRFMKMFLERGVQVHMCIDGIGYFENNDDINCVKIVYGNFGDYKLYNQGIVVIEDLEPGLPSTNPFMCLANNCGVITSEKLPVYDSAHPLIQLFSIDEEHTKYGSRLRFHKYSIYEDEKSIDCDLVMGINIEEGYKPIQLKNAEVINTEKLYISVTPVIHVNFRGSNNLLQELDYIESIINSEFVKTLIQDGYLHVDDNFIHSVTQDFYNIIYECGMYLRITKTAFCSCGSFQLEPRSILNCTVMEQNTHPFLTGNLQHISQELIQSAFDPVVSHEEKIKLKIFYPEILKLKYPLEKPVILSYTDDQSRSYETDIEWGNLLLVPKNWKFVPNLSLQLANRMFMIQKQEDSNFLEELEIKIPDHLEVPSNIESVLKLIEKMEPIVIEPEFDDEDLQELAEESFDQNV